MNKRHDDNSVAKIFGVGCLLVAGALLSLSACNNAKTVQTKVNPFEFVCYTDDKLSERHVGVVKHAGYIQGLHVLTYAEGGTVYYVQQRGEACGTEKL